ncbi:PLxRFG domain-containing protein [Comamonas thiooxydans]|uniref:PLxRFG domain-containing protein n=1 Tax=Comamonas thiooxydans TaxID=363952 RepID=UPI00070F0697|nr:PLxRFG domain-containing protein [Comamonas thiooxydans]
MAKKKTPQPRALSSFDDLDAAGIGAGYVSPFTPGAAPAADEPPKSRGLMSVANDTVIEAANAAAGGLSSAANFIKPGNAVSGWIDKNIIQAGEEAQSDVVKASKKKFREGVANADGVMSELGAVGGYIVENPLLAAAQAAGSFVGPGAAVKGAGMAARAAGVGAKGIERAGRAGGVAAGAAMAGGDAAGTAYDLAIKAGATEEEATAAARQASVIPALVGGAGGAFGAEKLLAGAKGFGGGAAARAAKTGLSEAAQEAVEEGVTQYEGQRAAIPFDPSIDPSKGVAAAAGMGAALGGMTGAGTSLLTGGHGPVTGTALDAAINQPQLTVEQAQAAIDSVSNGTASPDQLALLAQLQADRTGQSNVSPILDMDALQRKGVTPIGLLDEVALSREGLGAPVQVVPERGALSRAANLAAVTQQAAPLTTAAETQEQQQSAQPTEGADMETGEISPEARVGQIQEHLDFLAQMGRSQGWTNEALAQRTALQQELDLLSPAQRMADLQDQAAEADARAADWAGREYRPNPTELPEHAANGGPADIQEANEQRRLKNIQQAQQEAAAARAQVDQVEGEGNAQAQLAAQQDRAARVAQTAPDILNKQGKPFTVKLPAVKAAQAAGAGWEPVKVEGGYVVRQVQLADSPAPTARKVATPAPQEAMAKAEEIAREGNAQRQQVAQADHDAGARWDAMQPDAQRAVLAAVPKMANVIRQNLEGKAWEKMSAGNREKVLSAMNSVASTEQQQKNSEEKPIEGKDLGNGWAAFAPESGTKAVPRAQMPQIKAEHRGAMVNFMNARGIAHQEETVPAASLKPTQAEFSREKVKKALGYEGGDRSILVSQDGHVLDGHHQWMAAREQGKDVKTIRLDAPIEQLLEAAHEFPSSSTSGGAVDSKTADSGTGGTFTPSVGAAVEITSGLYQGNSGTVESISDSGRVVVRGDNALATGYSTTADELAPAAKSTPARKPRAAQAGDAEKARADYFTPGNIVKSYSGHDRVIAYTPPDSEGRWSVKVQAVRKDGDSWVADEGEQERVHGTDPQPREMKAGPVARAEPAPAQTPGSASPAATASKQPTLEAHIALMRRVREGKATAAELREGFKRTEGAREALTAELGTMKKAELLRTGGMSFAYRHKDDRKEEIVEALASRVLDEFSLGRNYGPSSYMATMEGIAKHKKIKAQALRDLVDSLTDEDISSHAKAIEKSRADDKARSEAQAKVLADPQTLEDFHAVMRHHVAKGDSRQDAFLKLTAEQRARYDALEAESTRSAREATKAKRRTEVASAGQTTAGDVIETKHTKHGHDLFVVQLAERVDREDYDTLNASARRMGGSYSSYRGNGAVPGFQFRTKDAAEAFKKLVAGDTGDAQSVAAARRDAFEDDRSQSAAQRLRTMAAALHERADESLSRDRKANTHRRAAMAASAEAAARADKAMAGTMENLAQSIEDGKAKFLDAVRQKVQVEFLTGELRTAKEAQLRSKYKTYAEQERHRGEPMDAETVDFADFPSYTAMRSDLAALGRQLQDRDGTKKLGARLMAVANDVSEAYTDWAKANLLQVSRFGHAGEMADFASNDAAERAIRRSGIADRAIVLPIKRGQNRVVLAPAEAMKQGLWSGDDDKRITLTSDFGRELVEAVGRRAKSEIRLPWQLESAFKKRQRLESMGISTGSEYRSALREFAGVQEAIATPDKIKQMERALIGRRADGLDFFPTSEAVVDSMLAAAEIEPGMAVLEPSAGMGHIADAIRERAGVEPDVVEMSGERRELLEAKGYSLVGSDFTEMRPRDGFTYGDVFRDTEGRLGVMRGSRGMGSDRVGFHPLDADGKPDAQKATWVDRGELTGVEQRDSDSGYDRIIMNPPFSKDRDIQHVRHAYELLRPGGRLVAIMGEGAFFHGNKAAESFRTWLDDLGATSERLPDGSFMDPSLPVNTSVAARMVVIDKPTTPAAGDSDTRFRRQEADADFDVDGFLQAMNDGQPVAQARAEAVSAVQKTVDAIRTGWANGPEVTVVYDMADPAIPAAARRADQAQRSGGADGDPEGFFYGGKAYLLASQLHTDKDVARVLMHEALGHHGLRGVFGTGLDSVLEQIVAVRRGDVRRKAAEYGLDYDKPAHRLQAAEEVLAEWAQTRPEMGFVRRAVAAIRSWLRQHVPGFKGMRVTDDELIRAYILPARGWVERGAGAGMARDIAFSRTSATSMPDAIIGSTLGSASSHPDYAAAKAGDIEAAFRLAQDIVTPELVAKVRAAIGDSKPVVVPVAAEEATGRNRIPVAAAGVLAQRLGLSTSGAIVQANRAHRTGMDGLDRIFAPVDFAGAVEAKPYLLVDDTLTQGGTFAALASHIREGGGTVAGVIALTGKQYSAKIQPTTESLASLRQKHGDLENEFRAATGYGFDSLTESEARYLARYEPADRLRDRISAEGHRGRSGEDQGNADPGSLEDGPLFSRSRLADIKGSALSQLDNILSHPGKVSMWDKTVGTMRHLAERNPFFKPVYESAQQNIDDVSMLANDAADQAPRILPRVDSMGDILGKNRKRPVSAADNKAVARPLFEGTLLWGRDLNGQAVLVEDLAKKYANLSAHNKAAMLLKANRIDAGVLAMWQGLPAQQYENMINSRFESKILKAGVVWSDGELQSQFGATADQISLYREARAAIDRSIDMTARADMMRTLGDGYAAMRGAMLEQPSLDSAGQLLLDMLEQDAKAVPDNRDRLALQMQQIRKRLEDAKALQESGYAPLSRFGRYTVDVVDAAGERQYFGMYETMREANTAARNFRLTFPDATVEQGTMSQQAYKLFAGVTPESLELFGNMLGLDSEGNAAQDKAFQEYLKLTKNNHSALKRMIHRKGTAGFSEDVGRVVANFVYSNARQAAAGLNVGALDKAINAIPKDQGELKDLAMGLRSYIQDPQEEGQAVRGMLFAQYLGGSLASAFVNMTQPFQVTLPWLSQYGGMKKAGAQLARALKDMGTKGFQYEADLAKALQSAEDDGVVSPQEIHQLMSQARGSGALRAGDGTAAGNARATVANAWERTKVAWGQPFALAEQFNRRSTFIASYRLAKEQGIQNPSAFARKAVLDTQFVYSKAVKPQWARGTIGGTLFTFKTYSVSYLELMQRMWTQGGKEGKRAVGWSIAMLMLMGGAGGLPFAEDIEDLIDAGGQLMGYSMSVKQWRKQLMQDVLGKELADFIEQGVSGLPGAPVDISGRLGMGNLIPGTGLFLEKRDHSRDMLEIIGPAGDLIQRVATGARKALTGDIAGAALEVSPTAVRNLAKGVDMADSGIYKDSKGRKVIDVTLGEAVAKAVGFQPKSVAETQEATATEQNLIGQNRAMKERLTADMAQAVYDKDVERQAEIRERQQAWNRRNPESPVFIDRRSVRQRVIKMRQTKAERVAAAAPKSIRANVRQSLAEAQGGTTAP